MTCAHGFGLYLLLEVISYRFYPLGARWLSGGSKCTVSTGSSVGGMEFVHFSESLLLEVSMYMYLQACIQIFARIYCDLLVRIWCIVTFKISRFKSLGSVSLRLIRIPASEIPAPDLTSLVFHPQYSHVVAITMTSLKWGISVLLSRLLHLSEAKVMCTIIMYTLCILLESYNAIYLCMN